MSSTNENPGVAPQVRDEIRRISIISVLALLLFGFASLLDGPITIMAWVLTAAGFLCIVYVIAASHSLLNKQQSTSRKADNQ
jgi:hypothetical protein